LVAARDLWETYGGMEGAATIAKPHRWLEKPGTVGRAVKGVSIKILDDRGHELPAEEIGNVYIEPGARTFEYRDDPELTASVSRGTAFTIGDVGYLDEDGYLFLCDRAKDMIISGGVNIYPAEVEAALSIHPLVSDVAVIGVPDLEWGEQVKAVVELVPDTTPSDELANELVAHCRERLSAYKSPRSVDFTANLPRSTMASSRSASSAIGIGTRPAARFEPGPPPPGNSHIGTGRRDASAAR
jgi:long-chain acyl-CoA synthetase